ncbi:Ku protein [Pseudalkalibacillus caeni]|uniref:Non-homologous end joining protein Ku n=1 Tax=Exobacillus caeni TaxID=2574798 RepID=A0A5R9F5U1_9BACL|nr:Ku protein [Pseudalkalibacillus caeni]TLS37859.1 Ku protein [Pseudalkalibacillus caeni]
MHTMWKGSISFGLVNIPIKLYAATEDKDIKTRMIHKECHTPIKYEKTCPTCEKEVSSDDIVRGYEYEQGKYVVLEKEELEALNNQNNKSIEIVDFVKLEEIDPIYYNRSYFVGPNENGGKPFMLLKKAMEDSGKIGVAKVTIRSKEHLALVRVYKKGLVLETMYFPDEVRSIDHVPSIPENLELSEKELDMANQLIDQLTTEFNPEKYKDERREAMMELIETKISGNEIKVPKAAPKPNVVDLMDALQASIDETKKEEPKIDEPKKEEPKKKKKKPSVRKKKASS